MTASVTAPAPTLEFVDDCAERRVIVGLVVVLKQLA
jgi:hypothetical protein